MEELRRDGQHRHVDEPGDAQGDDHVDPLEAQHAPALVVVSAGHAPARQRRVQVDHVRHHRRADDPDRQVQRVGPAQARYQTAQRIVRGGADAQHLIQEAGEDDPQQRGDRKLEAPEPACLKGQDRERDHARDQPGRQQRHAEEQVQPERRAEELGDVGGHRHDLRLHPHAPRDRPRVAGTDLLGQVVIRDDPQLRRQVLD